MEAAPEVQRGWFRAELHVAYPPDEDGVVAPVVAGVLGTFQQHRHAGQHRQATGVGDELAAAELVRAPGGEPGGQFGVAGVDHVDRPGPGPFERRVALRGPGQADQHQWGIGGDGAERGGREAPRCAVLGRGCHDRHTAGERGHRLAETRQQVLCHPGGHDASRCSGAGACRACASSAWPTSSRWCSRCALVLRYARLCSFGGTLIPTRSVIVIPYPSNPWYLAGLFVISRIEVTPRSARICAPMPYSRVSTGRPSARFASTVSRSSSWSWYARSLWLSPIPRPSWPRRYTITPRPAAASSAIAARS